MFLEFTIRILAGLEAPKKLRSIGFYIKNCESKVSRGVIIGVLTLIRNIFDKLSSTDHIRFSLVDLSKKYSLDSMTVCDLAHIEQKNNLSFGNFM